MATITTTTPVRVTKTMKLSAIIDFLNGAYDNKTFQAEGHSPVDFGKSDAIRFLNAEIAALAKKNSGERKQTETQKANEGFKKAILKFLEEQEEMFVPSDECPEFLGATCTEILKGIPEFSSNTTVLFSNQKISSLCNALEKEGKAVKSMVKSRSVFKAACVFMEEEKTGEDVAESTEETGED